ncbi:Galactosylgalactosylxylosylprotein 3-beta-glucuronosyltransferase 3 [Halotydeus destructor]|nr:Galactosylgalactosylxylosylprotein 3-beta-glucuronosyltransferase 3 [Halotydeus destructor]
MRFTSSQFKLIVVGSLGLTAVFAFVQIACFSSVLRDRKCRSVSDSQLQVGLDDYDDTGANQRQQLTQVIYAITPTYERAVQKAELTRLSYAFMHVKRFHWIIVEDSVTKTDLVSQFVLKTLQLAKKLKSDIEITHLNAVTPISYKTRPRDPNWLKPRGVNQRNRGIAWLRENKSKSPEVSGVVYFADDDNTYDLELFEEMRVTKTVSVWPVGLVGGLAVEKPHVEQGKVVGWNTRWKPDRPYPIDMAGFAVNLAHLLKRPEARFTYRVSRGFQESHLISLLVNGPDELEPKANHCSRILVWHTRTETPKLHQELQLEVPSNHGMDL